MYHKNSHLQYYDGEKSYRIKIVHNYNKTEISAKTAHMIKCIYGKRFTFLDFVGKWKKGFSLTQKFSFNSIKIHSVHSFDLIK